MQYTVSSPVVYHETAQLLQRQLRLKDFSKLCTAWKLLGLVFLAAARLTSLFAVCAHRFHTPSAETVRKALLATLPDLATLKRRLNRTLAVMLPKDLRHRKLRLAIDLTLLPYHGKPWARLQEIFRSQAKDGTSHFHAYATVYLVYRGQRFTLALTDVERGEALADVLKRLLARVSQLGLRPEVLLLDRGFYSVEVIRYLQRARYPFVMPMVARGRKAEHPQGPSASRVFFTWRRSAWSRYTLENAKGQKATVAVAVKCRNRRGQRRHGRQVLVYACWGVTGRSLDWVKETYRQRFGIETSYRQLHQGRVRTCTRNPLVRYFYVGVALVLRNVWVWLHYVVLSSPRRGRRQLRLERLRFKALLDLLQHVAEQLFPPDGEIPAERPMKLGFTT